MNRRIASLSALASASLLLATACGSENNGAARNTTASSGAASPAGTNSQSGKGGTIAFVNAVPQDPYSITLQCGAEDAIAKQSGWTLNYQASKDWDPTQQKTVLDAVMATHPDALLMVATDSTALQKPLEQAAATGIPVALLDTTVDDDAFATSVIATDNVLAGKVAFDGVTAKVSGGKVMTLATAPGISSNDQRVEGFQKAAEANPSFEYAGTQYDPSLSITKSAEVTVAALTKDPDIAAIFAANNVLTEGAVAGVKQKGLEGKVLIVGFDPTPETAALIRDGSVYALVAQQPYTMATDGVAQVVAKITGQPTQHDIATESFLITKENIDGDGAAFLYKTHC
jgi:ribose transport system substrate-binding protein